METSSAHAVAVLVVTPQGIPLVRDPKKPEPHYWKLPGGRSEEGETAVQCAVRELNEELGIALGETDLKQVTSQSRGNHTFTLFQARLPALPELKQQGDDGEDVRVFSPQQILMLPDFFPNHRAASAQLLDDLF